jgi:hypothetical protein
LIDQEIGSFQKIDNKWRPQNLFFELQTKELMNDMVRRYNRLKEAENELQTLDRAERLLRLMRKMGLILKRAHFVRRANHLAFGQAVSEFYTAYGEILRFLKIDEARGKLEPV